MALNYQVSLIVPTATQHRNNSKQRQQSTHEGEQHNDAAKTAPRPRSPFQVPPLHTASVSLPAMVGHPPQTNSNTARKPSSHSKPCQKHPPHQFDPQSEELHMHTKHEDPLSHNDILDPQPCTSMQQAVPQTRRWTPGSTCPRDPACGHCRLGWGHATLSTSPAQSICIWWQKL